MLDFQVDERRQAELKYLMGNLDCRTLQVNEECAFKFTLKLVKNQLFVLVIARH